MRPRLRRGAGRGRRRRPRWRGIACGFFIAVADGEAPGPVVPAGAPKRAARARVRSRRRLHRAPVHPSDGVSASCSSNARCSAGRAVSTCRAAAARHAPLGEHHVTRHQVTHRHGCSPCPPVDVAELGDCRCRFDSACRASTLTADARQAVDGVSAVCSSKDATFGIQNSTPWPTAT